MKTKALRIGIALLLPLAGCGGGAPKEAKDEASHGKEAAGQAGEAHPRGEHKATGEGLLTVDAEVLRDLKLTTFPAELRPGGEGVVALGELKVNEQAYAEVGAPIPGRIVRLLVAPGQSVRRGQPLAMLQSVELGQARAQRAAALARTDLARKTVERKRGLAAERIVSRGELQRAEADLAEAEANLAAAEAAVSALGVGVRSGGGDLTGFSLLSPIPGTVLERSAVQGQRADPSRPGGRWRRSRSPALRCLRAARSVPRCWAVVSPPPGRAGHKPPSAGSLPPRPGRWRGRGRGQ